MSLNQAGLLITVLLITSVSTACSKAEGPVVTRELEVPPFESIRARGAFALDVATGPEQKVTVTGAAEVLDQTVGERLKLLYERVLPAILLAAEDPRAPSEFDAPGARALRRRAAQCERAVLALLFCELLLQFARHFHRHAFERRSQRLERRRELRQLAGDLPRQHGLAGAATLPRVRPVRPHASPPSSLRAATASTVERRIV